MSVTEGAMSGNGVQRGRPATHGVLRVHPTRRCNLACAHCSTLSGPQGQEELPRELLHAAVKDAARLGYEHLEVSGGEPFLYDGLPGLLARARRLDFVTTVTTNGMLINQVRRWAPVAPLIDFLWVSIDGTETEHDTLRRREGAFAQTVRNLAVVRDAKVPFGFVFTLTGSSAGSLESVVRLAAGEGAVAVQVNPLELAGRAALGMADEVASGDQLAAALTSAQRLGAELGVAVQVDAVTRDELTLYRGRFVPQFPSRDLSALAPILIIESGGTVRPLSLEVPDRLSVGNIYRRRLVDMAKIWMVGGRAAELVAAYERAWWELADPTAAPASAWHREVAGRLVKAEAEAAEQPMLAAA